jgi:hypothetical protein
VQSLRHWYYVRTSGLGHILDRLASGATSIDRFRWNVYKIGSGESVNFLWFHEEISRIRSFTCSVVALTWLAIRKTSMGDGGYGLGGVSLSAWTWKAGKALVVRF